MWATIDNGSCGSEGCTISTAWNFDPNASVNDFSCIPFFYGCTDATMWNYNENANTDDDSCIPFVYGCTDPTAWNFNSEANTDDDSCIPFVYGCMDPNACNYEESVNTSDNSCEGECGCYTQISQEVQNMNSMEPSEQFNSLFDEGSNMLCWYYVQGGYFAIEEVQSYQYNCDCTISLSESGYSIYGLSLIHI